MTDEITMPRKIILKSQANDDGVGGCWVKKCRGKVYRLADGKDESDAQAYDAALLQWQQIKQQLDAAAPRRYQRDYEREIENWELMLSKCGEYGQSQLATLATRVLQRLQSKLALPKLEPLAPSYKCLLGKHRRVSRREVIRLLSGNGKEDPDLRYCFVINDSLSTWCPDVGRFRIYFIEDRLYVARLEYIRETHVRYLGVETGIVTKNSIPTVRASKIREFDL